MKLSLSRLREIILETAGQPDAEHDGASIDAQVDRLLASYETEAKNQKTEAADFRSLVRRLLGEAPGDEPTSKMSLDDIDVEAFANAVVRLLDNFTSLIEVHSTVVRRATTFLEKAYEPEVAHQFERVLRDEHGVVAGKSKDDVDDERFVAPTADRAGDGGSGPGAPPGG